jgi:hypothetical protein
VNRRPSDILSTMVKLWAHGKLRVSQSSHSGLQAHEVATVYILCWCRLYKFQITYSDIPRISVRFTCRYYMFCVCVLLWHPSFFSFLFFWWDCKLNLGLCACKEVIYHLSHTSSPFCSGFFGDGEEGFSWTICPGWPQTMIPLISAFQEACITGMSH